MRRTESIFFISLPFTALYATLLVGGTALAIGRGEIRHPDLTLGVSVGLAALASGLIAWRDHRAPAAPGAAARLAPAPESGTILLDSPR